MDVVRGTPPFVFMLILVAAALIYYPPIALFLRDLAFR
jgi:TRAP-type C4-dicarboxylate transport system permease large subunit